MICIRGFLFAFVLSVLFLSSNETSQAQENGKVLEKTKAEWLVILEKDPKPRMRKAAVIALGIFGPGDKDILPALNKALGSDKDDMVRLQIVAVLGSLDPKVLRDSLPTLADRIKDEKSAAVRAATASLIGKLGVLAKPALATLVGALKDTDASVRSAAMEAIGSIGPEAKSATGDMLPLLKDTDASVRYSTVFAFGRFGPDALPVLPNLLQVLENDNSADVRHEVAHALALIGGPAAKMALPTLIKSLQNDKSEEVRRQLALTLGKMGNIKAVMKEVLGVLKSDKDRTVRLYLVRSIPTCLGSGMKEYVKDYADLLNKDPDGDVRLAIIQELGALGPAAKEALEALVVAESDVVLQVREAAKQAIVQIKEMPKQDPKIEKK